MRGSCPSRWVTGTPGPSSPSDFHFPAGENLGAASLSGTGRGCWPEKPHRGPGLRSGLTARPQACGCPEGPAQAPDGRRWSRGPVSDPAVRRAGAATLGPRAAPGAGKFPEASAGKGRRAAGRPARVSARASWETRAAAPAPRGGVRRRGRGSPGASAPRFSRTLRALRAGAGRAFPGAGIPLSRSCRGEGYLGPPR